MLYRGVFSFLTLSFLFFIFGNWLLSFTSLDEGRNMSAVQHMLKTGDFISPVYNCQPRFEKPPMLYWSVSALSFLIGLNEFSARLVSGLSALGVSLLTYLFAKDFFSKDMALRASIILMTFPHMWLESRAVVPEMLNTFFSMLGLYLFMKERFVAGWVALALAFLTKGPVGVMLAMAIYLLWRRDLKPLGSFGLIIFVVLGSSWYLLMVIQHGYEYFYRFFIFENIMRYTGQRSTHPAPFYYYLPVILLGTLWYIPLYQKIVRHFRKEWIPLALWSGFVILFFSLASNKLHHYILLAYPPLAIMLAHVISERYFRTVLLTSAFSLILLLPVMWLYELQRFTPKASEVLRGDSRQVYFFRAEDSALVYYTDRCIMNLKEPQPIEAFVVTKEKYVQQLLSCSPLLKGREFDGVYYLLECRAVPSDLEPQRYR